MAKPRVLCLHGFTSNGSVHAFQVRSITKALAAEFEFFFPDAPHKVDMSKQNNPEGPSARAWNAYVAENSSSGHRAWWFARNADPSRNEPGGFHGLEDSLEYIGGFMKKTGPFDAIWGFSQGGCFAGLLTALLSTKELQGHPLRKHLPKEAVPQAGVFFSGFRARFPQFDAVYSPGISVPTLHVLGEKDDVVTAERSATLVGVCRDASVLKHAGGHEIPRSEEDQAVIIKFLREKVDLRDTASL